MRSRGATRILVTGGAGYIGTHICVELLERGYDIVVVDNLCNSCEEALERVRAMCGRGITFVRLDVRDKVALRDVFERTRPDAVIHLAGLKAVGESVDRPLDYYDNNVIGSLSVIEVMAAFGVKTLVFSSSATVYGSPASVPIREDFPLVPANPYGRTKLVVEGILRDLAGSDAGWRIAILRYFNPVGAHPGGRIGESPQGNPNNIMPSIAQVATGARPYLQIFGDDYPTPDGTGIRDYIHVTDLARGHVRTLEKLEELDGVHTWNLGTGQGFSVKELVRAFEKASQRAIACRIVARRPGDIPVCYADPTRAQDELGWRADKGLEDICTDTWRWLSLNPAGYR